ncbi:hypothetical protein ACSSS7_007514 [Eimeria intestinalis]
MPINSYSSNCSSNYSPAATTAQQQLQQQQQQLIDPTCTREDGVTKTTEKIDVLIDCLSYFLQAKESQTASHEPCRRAIEGVAVNSSSSSSSSSNNNKNGNALAAEASAAALAAAVAVVAPGDAQQQQQQQEQQKSSLLPSCCGRWSDVPGNGLFM